MNLSQTNLTNEINQQGGLFQDACRNLLENSEGYTDWTVEDVEHPVSNSDGERRIDIVLRSSQRADGLDLRAIVECKRVNPDRAAWVFPVQRMDLPEFEFGNFATLESTYETSGVKAPKSSAEPIRFSNPSEGPIICDTGYFAIKEKRANGRNSASQPIEEACRQALSGSYGLKNELYSQYLKQRISFRAKFIPIIVTTAPLFVAQYKHSDVDIKTGKINEDKIYFGSSDPEPVEWLVVDYPAGNTIDPNAVPDGLTTVNTGRLGRMMRRSVFIVNSGYLKQFFKILNLD
jgi:hypothetical protein